MRSKNFRIHHKNRLRAKRKHYHGGWNHWSVFETPKLCSCWMCGNPRKWFGEVTRQEKLADLEFDTL